MVNCCKGLATLLPKCSTFVILVVVVINLFIIHHFGVLITTRLSIEFEELRNRLSQDSEDLSNRLSVDFKQLKIHSSKEIQEVKSQLSNQVQVLTNSWSKDSLAISSRLSTELQQLKSHLSKGIENLTSHLSTKDFHEPCTLGNYFYLPSLSSPYSFVILLIEDYINSNRLPQDDRCVIEIIRRDYLHPPSPLQIPYALNHPDVKDPSAGQAGIIISRLNNLVRAAVVL